MLYHSHTNPTEIHCHQCGEDITLRNQTIVDSVIICDDCLGDDDELDLDE